MNHSEKKASWIIRSWEKRGFIFSQERSTHYWRLISDNLQSLQAVRPFFPASASQNESRTQGKEGKKKLPKRKLIKKFVLGREVG